MAVRTHQPEYEFGGPLGAFGIVFGLPLLLQLFTFACNDVAGCPVPSLLDLRSLSWEKLRAETGFPEDGIWGLASWEATGVVLGYYLVSLILYRVLPWHEVQGTKLRHHGRPLTYRFNAFYSTLVQLAVCAVGTYIHGADFIVWTYITDNYAQLLTAFLAIAYLISVFVYIRSFSVDTNYPNNDMRELTEGGTTGNMFYDFFIGRELNPRVTLPVFGEIDLKTWLEMRPGLTGWALLNLAFVAKQYRTYGYLSDSILFTAGVQAFYVLDSQRLESSVLAMMDFTTDGLGFMLSFGNVPWVPFLYSTQCRYLSVYPIHLGWAGIAGVLAVFALGLYIFRASNTQKHVFRTHPNDPSVAGMPYIQTKRGTRLLTAGWWGMSRHINYFGDWLQALPFSLPTGVSGYVVLPAGSAAVAGAFATLDGRQVVQGDARGWGILVTYFYALYFAVLLIHRERRDDAACSRKYGEDWEKYKKIVRWRILPGIY